MGAAKLENRVGTAGVRNRHFLAPKKKKMKEEETKKIKLIRQKRRVDSWVPGAGLECCLFCAGMDGAGRTGTKPGTRQVKGALSWWIKIWQSGRKASAWGGAR